MNHLRHFGRNIRPDYWARRGPYLPYYDPQAYYLPPGPYPVYPQNFYPLRYQYSQAHNPTNALGQLPVINSRPRVPPRSNTETQQPSNVAGVHMHHELWWNYYWTELSRGIIWDVALPPPAAARLSTPRLTIRHPTSEAPAITTQRRFNRIELLTDHPHLAYYMRTWGPVSVSETSNPTISQILQAIYEYLNTPLTEQDYRSICSNPHNVDRLNVARDCRVRDGFNAVHILGPFRRSDVIGGHRRFLGIRVVKLQDDILTLHFNLGPGPVPPFY